jgi:hypothetical protein
MQFEQLRCDEGLTTENEIMFPLLEESEGEWIDDEDLIPIDIPAIKALLHNHSISNK